MTGMYGKFTIVMKFNHPDQARAAGVFADALIKGRGYQTSCNVLGNALICSAETRGTTGDHLKKLADLIDLVEGVDRLMRSAEGCNCGEGEEILWQEWRNLRENLENGARN